MDATINSNDARAARDAGLSSWGPLVAASVVALLILVFAVLRIDFHADEAIYFSGIPVSQSNDSGLVFHWCYGLLGLADPSPITARWTSLVLGLVLIAASTRIVHLSVADNRRWIVALTPIAIACSYQGVFTLLRVRPEISWLTVASVAACSLCELEQRRSRVWQLVLILALLLLPMNHMLSYFACAFIGGYILLFGMRTLGLPLCMAAGAAMAGGVLLNRGVRMWITTGDWSWLPPLGQAPGGTRAPISEFLNNVFWASPKFLADASTTPSWWRYMGIKIAGNDGIHCFVATTLWAVALIAPILFSDWKRRYVAAVPAFALTAFYATGYFNPTYAPILGIYGVLLFLVASGTQRSHRSVRLVSNIAIAISLINGGSFLTTRVFNHGTATLFKTEAALRESLDAMPTGCVYAVSERLQSVVPKHARSKTILFKEAIPSDADVIIVDHYDFEMYRFVHDYPVRRLELENAIHQMNQISSFSRSVYKRENLFDRVRNNQSIACEQGSWFFRNSVNYRISLLVPKESTRVASIQVDDLKSVIER